ncbi:phospholipase [Clostridium novyi A str. 4552]|uniref:Phospholipase n=1 Tax=Clostridium novyi A str. 4552 TaxID=1444289 RepID=A0A0A0I2J9_CLONO|nr:patatin-like phospholipase family protein [Clostridium novyi]KGM94551.1 phospholipase [Clostridium novyi A str. 4552]
MRIDAVFEGGGVKGIGLVGAVSCLEDKGCIIENVAGTSAGAMIASLVAVGYKSNELKEIIMNIDYNNFLDKKLLYEFKPTSLMSKGVSLLKNKGIYSGDAIEHFMRMLFIAKGKTKFKDVSKNGKSRLKIIASDITRGDMLILPDDIKKYGIDPMEMDIARAVRMSISIPLYFKPVQLKYKNKISFIVDGGILSNYPIWIFDVEGVPKWPTIGMKLISDTSSFTAKGNEKFIPYLMDINRAMLNKNEEVYVTNKNWVRTIPIPTLGVNTTDFDIDKETSLKLFESGCKSAEKFLSKWNFNEYKKRYRNKNIKK